MTPGYLPGGDFEITRLLSEGRGTLFRGSLQKTKNDPRQDVGGFGLTAAPGLSRCENLIHLAATLDLVALQINRGRRDRGVALADSLPSRYLILLDDLIRTVRLIRRRVPLHTMHRMF